MLAVAVADVEVDGDFHFERQKVGTTPIDLRRLADWLSGAFHRKNSSQASSKTSSPNSSNA